MAAAASSVSIVLAAAFAAETERSLCATVAVFHSVICCGTLLMSIFVVGSRPWRCVHASSQSSRARVPKVITEKGQKTAGVKRSNSTRTRQLRRRSTQLAGRCRPCSPTSASWFRRRVNVTTSLPFRGIPPLTPPSCKYISWTPWKKLIFHYRKQPRSVFVLDGHASHVIQPLHIYVLDIFKRQAYRHSDHLLTKK